LLTSTTEVLVADPQLVPREDETLAMLCLEKLCLSAYFFILLEIRAL
jgi:hypothetical protein